MAAGTGLSPCCCLIPGAGSISGLSIHWATPGKALLLPPAVFLLLTLSFSSSFSLPLCWGHPACRGQPAALSLPLSEHPKGCPDPAGSSRDDDSHQHRLCLRSPGLRLPPSCCQRRGKAAVRKEKPSRAALPRLPSSKPYSIPPECNNWSSCCLPGWGKPHTTEPGPPVAPHNQPYPPSWGLPAWRCRFLGEQAWCWGRAVGVTHPIPLGFSPAPLRPPHRKGFGVWSAFALPSPAPQVPRVTVRVSGALI